MARQDGIIKFKGQMGGISFYKTAEDGYLARQKGGVDASRLQNDPAFARTRENGAEFGRATAAGRLLRTALRALIMNSADSRMSLRLTSEMVKVIQADATNARGLRSVVDGEAELLQGFEFNVNAKLTSTFFAPFTGTINRATGIITVDVPAFISANMIAAPQGATHFRLNSAGVEINFESGSYVVNSAQSVETVIDSVQTPAINLQNAVTPASTSPLFLAFGIEFLQQVNGKQYPLNNGAFNALALVAVDGGA